jgi:hypothetical protein
MMIALPYKSPQPASMADIEALFHTRTSERVPVHSFSLTTEQKQQLDAAESEEECIQLLKGWGHDIFSH